MEKIVQSLLSGSRTTRRCVLAAASVLALSGAWAQATYPSQPIKYLIGFQAGGGSDLMGRWLTTSMAPLTSQSIHVENRAGATGLLALDAITAAPADGHTVHQLMDTTTNSLHFTGRALDPDKRFLVVGRFAIVPLLVVVNPKMVDVKSVSELVAYAKRNPGMLYTSSGPGSPSNLMMEALGKQQGLSLTHVPYKGSGPAITDVIGGRVGVMVVDSITAKAHLASGALRAVAVASSIRTPLAPEATTATEQGFPILTSDPAAYLVVPPRTPAPVVSRLSEMLQQAVANEAKVEEQRGSGMRFAYMAGPAAREQMEKDFNHWGRLIKEFNVKVTE